MLKKHPLFILMTIVALFIWISGINGALFLFINAQHNILPDSVWDAINTLANPAYGILLLAPLLLALIFRRKKVFNILLLILAYCLVFKVLKTFVHEPRPFITYDLKDFFWIPISNAHLSHYKVMDSFPSGHAGAAAIFTFSTIHLLGEHKRWLRVLLIAFLILVMLTRVCTGWHFPLDVLVAALLGFVLTEICWNLPLFRFFQKRT